MTRKHLSAIRTLTAIAVFLGLAVIAASFFIPAMGAAQPQGPSTGPKIWLQDSQSVPVNHVGTALLAGQAQPLATASADLDGDGIADLVIGYSTPSGGVISVQRGNLDAFAPQSAASFQAIAQGRFPSPFLPDAQIITVPVTPDFLAAGNFTGTDHQDLVVAARGGSALYLLAGDGKGSFAAPQTVDLAGVVTALAAGHLGNTQQFTRLIVGVTDAKNQSSVQVFAGTEQGLAAVAAYPLQSAASAFDFGDLDGDNFPDAAVLAGGQVSILHGSNMQMEAVSLPVSASAITLGSFIHDRDPRVQMALFTPDGTVHIAVHESFDPRPFTADEIRVMRHAAVTGQPNPLAPAATSLNESWKIVESFASAAPFVSSGTAPVMFRTRISSNAADDVMVLNAAAGQMAVISHPNLPDGAATFVPGAVSIRPYIGSPVAAIAARVNIDGRPGVIALHQGQIAPAVMMPLPDPIFNVNTTADTVSPGACAAATPGQCSLREAIIEANAAPGVDTINVPAGTYTLTRTNATPTTGENAASTGDLDITDGVTIMGAGSATTIVQAGTNNTNGIDKVFSINPLFNKAFDTSISGMTIRFGHNQTSAATDGFGGGFDWEASGTGTLQVTDVVVTDNSTDDGDGGGIALTNTPGGAGSATISMSVIQNNVVRRSTGTGAGGGIFAGQFTTFSVDNTQILNNQAAQASGNGGGVHILGPSGSVQTQFHAVTISGNHAGATGGGIHTGAGILIDQGSVISNNVAGTNGGGLWTSVTGETTTVSNSTITGNSATGSGGGIRVDNSTSNNFVMDFSRIAGNTASSGSALSNGTGIVTATNNWWGTNSPAGGITAGTPAATFDPFIVLGLNAGSTTLSQNTTTTLTADLAHDNHGTGIAPANLTGLAGAPIAFSNNTSIGSITSAQATIQSTGTATATYTAAGPGTDSVVATVDNGTATVNITVTAPPTPPVIIKAFGAASIPLNGSTSLTFTIQNSNTTTSLTGIAFSDTLPAGLVVATPNGLAGSCGAGTITATAGTGVISLSGGSIAASSSCTFSVTVTGTAAGTQNNTTGNVTSTEGGTGGTASASINVVAPPSIAKVFNPAAIALNATTSLTFTITNPAANAVSLTGVAFTDTLPTGLTVANASATVCGGTLTTTAPTGISLSGATIAANSQCQFSVTVTGAAAGSYTNTTGNVTSTNGGTGNTASANLTVATPPTIAKSFGAASIPLNGSTSLTFNITNPNAALNLTGLAFTDNLPAGLVVASTPGISNTCGGTVTAVGGASSVSLSAGTLASSASCAVSVSVLGTTAGVKNNSVQVSSTESGTGNTSNASITVIGPPVIIKAFGAASIPLNGSTSLTFTIQNNNTTVALTGVAFSDTLPAGLVVATPNGLSGTCGGAITATQGTGVISLSGGSIAASSSCTFSVNVTGTAAGTQNNTTGNVTSTEGGTGGTASASINVVAPPSIAKVFNPAGIALNATTSLTFTITNPAANAVSLTGVAFADTLPTGLAVANASATVCGGTLTTTAPTGISLSGATIAANSQCQFSVTVTGAAAGSYTNTTGNVTSTNGGTGNTASANLTVATPPTIAKSFGAASIPLNGATSLTFTLTNSNTNIQLNGVAFTDSLPAGLVVATPNGLTGTASCASGTTAVAGSGTISLGGTAMGPSSSCTVTVNVTGTTPGIKNNSVTASATESGPGNTSNASITVIGPPVIIKAFGAAGIPLNGSTSLSFTIQNNNTTTTLTGISFSDTLPTGLIVSTPNGLTGTCGGGTITATAGTGSVSLSGAALAASSSCTFSINVTGTTSGAKNNTTGNVTSTEGGTGGTASASLSVEGPPSIAKAFNPVAIAVNGTSTLTLTITNPAANAAALTGAAVTDNLPAGLIVATPNGLTNTCGGTATATAGSGSISLTGGTVATNSNCAVSVNVTSSAAGTYVNTTGAVSSTNGGTGNTATATLTVQPADLTITKTHAGTFTRGQTGAIWTITINNAGAGPTTGTVTVVDTLPNVTNPPVATAISGTGWTCTLATLTCTRSDALAPGVAYPAISLTVDIPINAPNTFTNTATVSGGGETNTGNDSASDTINLGPPIIITPHGPTSMTITAGSSGTIDFDVTSSDPSQGFVGFTCAGLPIGASCDFTPGAISAGSSQMTMTISTTSRKSGSLTGWNFDSLRPTPLYALLFPLFGLALIGVTAGKGRKLALRRMLALTGLATLLVFAGCGGRENPIATPPGNYQITVTAVSLTAQATTTITLTVQ